MPQPPPVREVLHRFPAGPSRARRGVADQHRDAARPIRCRSDHRIQPLVELPPDVGGEPAEPVVGAGGEGRVHLQVVKTSRSSYSAIGRPAKVCILASIHRSRTRVARSSSFQAARRASTIAMETASAWLGGRFGDLMQRWMVSLLGAPVTLRSSASTLVMSAAISSRLGAAAVQVGLVQQVLQFP